jgi:NADPH-dependent 2,4-dienoyl-CoA reductase/sulfur reductase-like enzyme
MTVTAAALPLDGGLSRSRPRSALRGLRSPRAVSATAVSIRVPMTSRHALARWDVLARCRGRLAPRAKSTILVVVGGGLSGLAAALEYRQRAGARRAS